MRMKTKMLTSFKNLFRNKNWQTQKLKHSDLKAWKQIYLQGNKNRELCDIPKEELNLLLC